VTLADEAEAFKSSSSPKAATLGKIADLLERNGIDVDDIGRVEKVNLWQGFMKDADGLPQVVDLAGVSLSPSWETGPQWPVIQPAPTYRLPAAVKKPRKADGYEPAVIFPDIQAGYFRGPDGLEPIHDEAAIAVALAITADLNPDLVVLVGDNADFVEFGKYRHSPAFQQTTQATIDRLGRLCAELRAAAPNARIVWIAGNHEERLPNYLLDNARAAFGLRRAGDPPTSWPVLSVPDLCHFDRYGIEYLPGYPASTFWINDRLRVIHGDKVASGGSTAHKYLANEKVSCIYGHVHRREYGARTREDRDGAKEIMAASPGCLARIDGAVPSTKGGTDLDGRPLTRIEDWQQGIAVVHYQPGDGRFTYANVAIHDGWALWNGREYTA
jgi:predicted phosphodiesterase